MKKLNDTLIQISNLLNGAEFVDGTTIGEQLNISRTAVWKIIKKLKNYGIEISSSKGKGYRLDAPLILLDEKKINSATKEPIDIEVFEQLDSTNEYLKNFFSSRKIKMCVAEKQTNGRGRFKRNWHSPFAQNITLSLLYPFNNDISKLAGLSLVTSLAVCKALDQCYQLPHPLKIKWPNDIVCNNKKLAGSLIEVQAETNGFCSIIIGIGININMKNDDEKRIDQPWTSIRTLNNQYNDRNELCSSLINHLIDYIRVFEQNGFNDFVSEWQSKDNLHGQQIKLQFGQNIYQGICQGVNEQGHLMLMLESGETRGFSSGDATIVKG